MVIVVILLLIVMRALRGIKGTKYSARSLFIRPAIYIVLTVVLVFALALWQDVFLLLSIVTGVLLGLFLGKRANIFEKEGQIMFKRSMEVTVLWLVAYVIRIGIDFLFDPAFQQLLNGTGSITSFITSASAFESSPIVFVADLLLAVTAGLLLGEALQLLKAYNAKYKNKG